MTLKPVWVGHPFNAPQATGCKPATTCFPSSDPQAQVCGRGPGEDGCSSGPRPRGFSASIPEARRCFLTEVWKTDQQSTCSAPTRYQRVEAPYFLKARALTCRHAVVLKGVFATFYLRRLRAARLSRSQAAGAGRARPGTPVRGGERRLRLALSASSLHTRAGQSRPWRARSPPGGLPGAGADRAATVNGGGSASHHPPSARPAATAARETPSVSPLAASAGAHPALPRSGEEEEEEGRKRRKRQEEPPVPAPLPAPRPTAVVRDRGLRAHLVSAAPSRGTGGGGGGGHVAALPGTSPHPARGQSRPGLTPTSGRACPLPPPPQVEPGPAGSSSPAAGRGRAGTLGSRGPAARSGGPVGRSSRSVGRPPRPVPSRPVAGQRGAAWRLQPPTAGSGAPATGWLEGRRRPEVSPAGGRLLPRGSEGPEPGRAAPAPRLTWKRRPADAPLCLRIVLEDGARGAQLKFLEENVKANQIL